VSVVYEYMVDWDADDWTATPDFSEGIDDITNYVKSHYMQRGKNDEAGNVQSGTIDITLHNADKRFSPPYAAGPLYGKIRPWLPIRVRATMNGTTETFYTGFISRIKVDPSVESNEAYLYCTDGMDLLARQMVTQDGNTRTTMCDGEAVGKVLDASGWPAGKRAIDVDAGDIIKYPTTVEF